MKSKDTDVMVRIKEELYGTVRRLAKIREKKIRILVGEILQEYVGKIPQDEKKLIEQMVKKANEYK
jgi:hypothetical protein